MDQVWGVEVTTTHGHKVYHAAVLSEAEAKTRVIEINQHESPHIEATWPTENLWHLQDGVCRQVLPP
jgi:hypothetical protein